MRAVLPSRELSKASISKSSRRRVKNGSLFCAGIFPVCETPECLPISRPANALFLPSREVKRYLSKPFFSRPIKTPAAGKSALPTRMSRPSNAGSWTVNGL